MVQIPELEIGDGVQVPINNIICTAQVLRPTNAEAQDAILVLKNPHTWYGAPQLFRRVPVSEIEPLYRTVNGIRRTYRRYYNPYSLSLYETHLKHVDESLERLFQCEEFSNISGLGQIRFPAGNISAKFEEVRQVLERE